MILRFLFILLLILWYLGYIHLGLAIPDIILFTINGHAITLYNALIAVVILAIINLVPYPFSVIIGVFLALLVLSFLGILPILGSLSHILVIAVIVTFVIFLLGG